MLSYTPKLPPYELSDTRTGIQFCREMNVGAKAALDELLTGGAGAEAIAEMVAKAFENRGSCGGFLRIGCHAKR